MLLWLSRAVFRTSPPFPTTALKKERRNSKGCSRTPFLLPKTFQSQLAQFFGLRPAARARKSGEWTRPPMSQGTGKIREGTSCVSGVGQMFLILNSENKALKLFTVLFTIKFLVKNRDFKKCRLLSTCLPHLANGSYRLSRTHASGRLLALGRPDPPLPSPTSSKSCLLNQVVLIGFP